MTLTLFAILAATLGVFGAVIHAMNAMHLRDGREALRLFAAFFCGALAVAYFLLMVGALPDPLPPQVARPLFIGVLVALGGFGIVERWGRRR